MDERTLAALRGSIKKWRAIEEGRGADEGISNCPLCKEFITSQCDGCPVDVASGGSGCGGTPYDGFYEWNRLRTNAFEVLNPRVHTKGVRLARAEREFLESLLPEGEEP